MVYCGSLLDMRGSYTFKASLKFPHVRAVTLTNRYLLFSHVWCACLLTCGGYFIWVIWLFCPRGWCETPFTRLFVCFFNLLLNTCSASPKRTDSLKRHLQAYVSVCSSTRACVTCEFFFNLALSTMTYFFYCKSLLYLALEYVDI